jgi:hypothetical protein
LRRGVRREALAMPMRNCSLTHTSELLLVAPCDRPNATSNGGFTCRSIDAPRERTYGDTEKSRFDE